MSIPEHSHPHVKFCISMGMYPYFKFNVPDFSSPVIKLVTDTDTELIQTRSGSTPFSMHRWKNLENRSLQMGISSEIYCLGSNLNYKITTPPSDKSSYRKNSRLLRIEVMSTCQIVVHL